MKSFILLAAMALASPAAAGNWIGKTQDGVRQASVSIDASNQILVLCDAGINAPITSINFLLEDTQPQPNSVVMIQFDKSDPIYATTDEEGGIGSFTADGADQFDEILTLLKTKNKVRVRLFNGVTKSFALSGSTKAIGPDCVPDYSRYQIASQ